MGVQACLLRYLQYWVHMLSGLMGLTISCLGRCHCFPKIQNYFPMICHWGVLLKPRPLIGVCRQQKRLLRWESMGNSQYSARVVSILSLVRKWYICRSTFLSWQRPLLFFLLGTVKESLLT